MAMASFPNAWELASVVSKLLFYFGAASLAGGVLYLLRYNDGRRQTVFALLCYVLIGAFLGFQAILLNFLIQVGIVNGRGIGGMFDWGMTQLLLDTQIGDASFFRLSGFALALVASVAGLVHINRLDRPPTPAFYRLVGSCCLLAFLLLLMGFRFTGHVSVLGPLAKAAIAGHVLAVALWMGSLWPLYRLSAHTDLAQVQVTMGRFGRDAVAVLIVLGLAGLILAWQLFASWSELVTSAYGIAFLTKMSLVALIMAVAAWNKFRLTPAIVADQSAAPLRRSIRLESILALLILLVTAYFATVVGPAEH